MKEKCDYLEKRYADGSELYRDINDLIMLIKNRRDTDFPEPKIVTDLLSFIISYGEDVFPNLRIDVQILLTIGVSIASCERSLRKLKSI